MTTTVIRFPNGDIAYDLTRDIVPSVGETFRRNGVLWLVTRATHGVVHVEPVEGTPILLLRFPDGDVEYRSTGSVLPVGVLVRSRGALWRVRAHEHGAVILAEASLEDQASHGPVTAPTPIGDRPVLLETVLEI